MSKTINICCLRSAPRSNECPWNDFAYNIDGNAAWIWFKIYLNINIRNFFKDT